jgi:UDP-glucose 4-epimerase
MARTSNASRGLRVAVTGASGDLGRLLLPRLQADPRVERILVLDLACPQGQKLEFHRVDLTRHDVEGELVEVLGEEPVDALYHLAFRMSRAGGALAHELEVSGTMSLLAAASQVQLARLIVPSLTVAYGAWRGNPALLTEEAALQGCADSRFVTDKVEVERQVREFKQQRPDVQVVVLRMAPIVGPRMDNPATRLLSRRMVPTLLGFDPLWQALHEEDAAEALHLALHAQNQGVFNIVGEGVLPLSGLVREAGHVALPLPHGLLATSLRALGAVGAAFVPLPLLDYMRFGWVADGRKAAEELGFTPRFHTRDAVASLRRS